MTRPRILTWRLIVAAFVTGVVLAVVSVPVGVVVGGLRPVRELTRQRNGHFFQDGHLVFFDLARGPASERWGSLSSPHHGNEALSAFDREVIPLVTRDPRPAMARTALDGQVRTLTHYRAGWPWRSAGGVTTTFPLPVGDPSVGVWKPTALGREHAIPYLPLWPGLVGNVVFYALLVLASVALVRWVRLRRRARRSQCLACGYELGAGVEVCPECGLASAHTRTAGA